MKKVNKLIYLLLVFSFFFIDINVYALDHALDELIPVTEEANVLTETFTYTGIKFVNDANNVVNGKIKFESIKNNTQKPIPPSINILLFDAEMKNIGYITYCASKDYGSDNSFVKLSKDASAPFEFNVSSKYFGSEEIKEEGMVSNPSQIAYYAVHDDNRYCQVGGYTKYLGFTIEEITGNKVFKRDLELSDLILYLPYFLIGLVALIGYGLFLNTVYKRMHARTSILSYLPLTNFYITVKLAFGKKVAWIVYILCLVSFFIAYNSSNMTYSSIILVFIGICTLLDFIKLITGKYELFLIGERHIKTEEGLDGVFSSHNGSRFIETGEKNTSGDDQVTSSDFLNSIYNDTNTGGNEFNTNVNTNVNDFNNAVNDVNLEAVSNSSDVVDISYSSDQPIVEDEMSSKSNSFPVVNNLGDGSESFGKPSNILTPVSNVAEPKEEEKSELSSIYGSAATSSSETSGTSSQSIPKLGEDAGSGESELSNFFR